MSFRMDVKVEKVLEDGSYDAKLVNVERMETRFGVRLMWTFEVAGENTEVVGFTSMSPSTKAKAYQWAAAIAGNIDPKLGWGPEDVIGGEWYLAVTSRLLERPVSIALKGPSSGGKSHVVERVLSFVPESAYYALTAMSEPTLAYSEEPIKHRFLVICEAAGMSGEFATYLMRSLLSEGRVRYETVEKTSEGIKARLIEREGPTGLIVTTTATRLHPENETRLLSLTVSDTQAQTQAVMVALANEVGQAMPDLEVWHALQVWLESAEHRVCIPYAKQLAALIPPVAVRLRRDFGALLNLIRAHALLHQATRERDAEGRIVATIEDYAAVRELVVDLVGEGVEATVPATVRETVEAVKRLREDSNGEPVTVTDLARELRLDRSAVSRRVRNAKDRGYLRDLEENLRKPSRLVLGDDLPDDLQILPKPEDVRAGMQKRASSNARPDEAQEPHRNGQNLGDAYKACSCARVQEGIKTPLPPQAVIPETLITIKTTSSSKKCATCSLVTPWRRYEGSYCSARAVQGV